MSPRSIAILTGVVVAVLLAASATGCRGRSAHTPAVAEHEQVALLAVGWSAGPPVEAGRSMTAGMRGVILKGYDGAWTDVPLKHGSPSWFLNTVNAMPDGVLTTGYDEVASTAIAFFFDGQNAREIPVEGCEDVILSDCDVDPDGRAMCAGWKPGKGPVMARLLSTSIGNDDDKDYGRLLKCEDISGVSPAVEIYAIGCFAPGKAVAVGGITQSDQDKERGVILSYSDGSWSSASPVGVSESWVLNSLSIGPDGSGYLVGADNAAYQGLMLAYDNGRLTRIDLPRYSDEWWILFSIYCTAGDRCLLAGAAHPGEGMLLLWRREDVMTLSVARPFNSHSFESLIALPGNGFALCGNGIDVNFGFVLTQIGNQQRLAEFPELGSQGGYQIMDIAVLPQDPE